MRRRLDERLTTSRSIEHLFLLWTEPATQRGAERSNVSRLQVVGARAAAGARAISKQHQSSLPPTSHSPDRGAWADSCGAQRSNNTGYYVLFLIDPLQMGVITRD